MLKRFGYRFEGRDSGGHWSSTRWPELTSSCRGTGPDNSGRLPICLQATIPWAESLNTFDGSDGSILDQFGHCARHAHNCCIADIAEVRIGL